MTMTVYVREFGGAVIERCVSDVRFTGVLDLAADAGLSYLGKVDPYDDTVFNRTQAQTLVKELDVIRRMRGEDSLDILELRRLLAIVDERPHRYLVFDGD
ncbi:hypothetical protein HII36_12330 [Nonomuraea sp. NN258]|uniref:hypothetical protein n=1 Tax=Nonomuraea antri TaxID=2730852 RepID=UPI0015687184|nr:hypothetical protein [Nonomuraea antri]NRQ32618.1 hypothetical protein [Nonomuraea antri]